VVWLAKASRTYRFEVGQAQQRMLNAENNFVRTQERYKQELDTFKITLALPTDANIELVQDELRALEEAGMQEFDYTQQEAIDLALANRLDLANTHDQVADAERKVMVAADNLGVELNLIGSAGVGSEPETKFARLQFQDGTYGLGFEGDLNLDQKAERNAYRESLIILAQRQRMYDEAEDQVKLDVRQALRDLMEASTSYKIQQQALKLAKRRVENQELLLQAGRAITRDLLEAQDALLAAQIRRTQELVNYTIARLEFLRDVGILQVRPDGLWEKQEKQT
jgi:outer membrane protein TolC